MSVRLPLQAVLDYNNTNIQAGGPTSVIGGVTKVFVLPQDTDNVVVKFQTSILGGGASATFQTSDDGGTTWWDVARTSIVSNAIGPTAEWLSVPTISEGGGVVIASTVAVGSVVSASFTTGQAGASTLSQKSFSGLPIMSTTNRVFLRYSNAVTSILSERVTVLVNNQANRS